MSGERTLTSTILLGKSREGRLQADSALRKAATYGPDLPETITAQGWYASNVEGDPEKALDHFETALRASPNDPQLVGAIGLLRVSQGRWEEGLPYLERALRLDPRSEGAVATLELLLSHPGLLSVPILELDPLWDPLRERPDFQRLLDEYR